MPGGPLHGRGCGATGPRHAGQALIRAARKMPAQKHHVGMMIKSPAILEISPCYGTLKSDKRFSSYQDSHMYHRKISRESRFVIRSRQIDVI